MHKVPHLPRLFQPEGRQVDHNYSTRHGCFLLESLAHGGAESEDEAHKSFKESKGALCLVWFRRARTRGQGTRCVVICQCTRMKVCNIVDADGETAFGAAACPAGILLSISVCKL